MTALLLCQGTALHLPLKDASVHVCVCSPPYFALRRYDCGPGELGLEDSPDAYVDAMVQVFREVKRVLHPTGTLWLNVGTTYQDGQDLGIPWRLAFALKADGWRLRSEIIYAKLNPMPESVQTRPTRAHEQVFLFSKQAKYHYDGEAVKENVGGPTRQNVEFRGVSVYKDHLADGVSNHVARPAGTSTQRPVSYEGRACRSVWRLASEPLTGFQHYATFPTALVRRCLLAGAPSRVCARCRAPHRRVVERQRLLDGHIPVSGAFCRPEEPYRVPNGVGHYRYTTQTTDHGFEATCRCEAGTSKAVVLDPFVGSGTVPLVARELGHHAVGVDLSLAYLRDIARTRLGLTALHEWTHGAAAVAQDYGDLPLFGG